MKILALEFSSQLRSVAVAGLMADGKTAVLSATEDGDFRGVTGLMLIDRALQAAEIKPAEITLIVLGLGPGSYTGIRSAIAIAQGWQLGRGVKVAGLSSTLCLAEEARRRGLSGEVITLVDAQRGEVYSQGWHLDREGARELDSLRIALPTVLPADRTVIGPEASRFVPSATDLCPSASTLATLTHLTRTVPAEQLEPIYLRQAAFVKAPPPRRIGGEG